MATDGTATVMGRKTGVGVQLKSKYAPLILQTHCVAHRLNLACVDSIKEKDFLVKFRDKFTNLFNFITVSANLKKNVVEAVFESYSSILAT